MVHIARVIMSATLVSALLWLVPSHSLATDSASIGVLGTWESTGAMATPRYAHAAVPLRDGRVLVVGGRDAHGRPTATAELYDPKARAWRSAGRMRSARAYHAAIRLRTGDVLVVGGSDGSSALATAELYDPTTGRWRKAGSMNTPRLNLSPVMLHDGRILVAGGWPTPETPAALASSEVFDPRSKTWRLTSPLREARVLNSGTNTNPQAVALGNGEVLVVGGTECCHYTTLPSTELFSPETGIWRTATPTRVPRGQAVVVRLRSGRVLAAGGTAEGIDRVVRSAEVYTPWTRRWRMVRPMAYPRSDFSHALLSGDRVFVVGGIDDMGALLDTAEVFDGRKGRWFTQPTMPAPIAGAATAVLPGGAVLVAGGLTPDGSSTADALLWRANER